MNGANSFSFSSYGNISSVYNTSKNDVSWDNTYSGFGNGSYNNNGEVETINFNQASPDEDISLEFNLTESETFNAADLIKGSVTMSDGSTYSLYGADTEGDSYKEVVDWIREEIENTYNPNHSGQFYTYTPDEVMEKYFYEVLGIDLSERRAMIEEFKKEHAAELSGTEYSDSEIWSAIINSKMVEAYVNHQNELYEESCKKYEHFDSYILQEMNSRSVIYSEYAGVDINTLSDEEKIKWFYEFIDNEAKMDFANNDYKNRFNNAETWAEKEQIFAESCMYMCSVRMAEIDEQKFQDSLTPLEKIAGVIYETGRNIGKNFETLWNSDSFLDAAEYVFVDGTLQLFNDIGDGFVCLGGQLIKGVGGLFVDDKELWNESVGESVQFWSEGSVSDMALEQRMKNDVRFQDADYLNTYYAARQLGRDGEMMLLNIFGATEIALPASILSSTGQQFNSALAQGASYSDAMDYGSLAGTFDGTVNFLFARALGSGASGGTAAEEMATKGLINKIIVGNGGKALFCVNVAQGYAQPWINTLFKASTFSDESYSDLVKKDKVMENSVISGTSTLVMMSTTAIAKDSALGRKFEELTAKTKEATSFKNQTAIFVAKDLKEFNELTGGERITTERLKDLKQLRYDLTHPKIGGLPNNVSEYISRDIDEIPSQIDVDEYVQHRLYIKEKAETIGLSSETVERHLNEITARLDINRDKAAEFLNIYYDGMIAAKEKYSSFFKNFRDHSIEHTREVTDYAVNLARKAQKSGIDVDIETIAYAAMCHDLGMAGGVTKKGDFTKAGEVIDDVSAPPNKLYYVDENGYEQFIKLNNDQMEKIKPYVLKDGTISPEGVLAYAEAAKPKKVFSISELTETILPYSKEYQLAELVRENHPLNSALTVLSSDLVPEGKRAEVALLAMSHSKSTSGIKSFNTKDQWIACIDELAEICKVRNIPFDAKTIKSEINKKNSTYLKKLQAEALCVRDGDAMSVVPQIDGKTLMQTGTQSLIDIPEGFENLSVQANFQEELIKTGLTDTIISPDGTSEKVINQFSQKVHVGETNVHFDSDYRRVKGDTTTYDAVVKIDNPKKTPVATMAAIEERLGEVITYDSVSERTFTIELPKSFDKGGLDAAFGNVYRNGIKKFKTDAQTKFGVTDFSHFTIDIKYV